MSQYPQDRIRNVAIIAHVDHGKTTLVDGLLRQGNVFRAHQEVAERVLDSYDLERERGITIVSKNTAVSFGGYKINIVDTPGHADFGGEVERVMNMVDGVLLLVDAVDGPMPQTRFVTSKALAMGHRAVVVVNKIDRADARPDWVVDQTFDLFVELGATEEQLDFPVVYACARQGTATLDLSVPGTDLTPLFETIIRHLPAPQGDPEAPLQMLVSSLDYDEYRGRFGIGKIYNGRIHPGDAVVVLDRDARPRPARVVGTFVFEGLKKQEQAEVCAGEICIVSGIADIGIGETIASREHPVAIPGIAVDEPTLRMSFGVNTSPLAGREGQFSTSRKLRERLFKELETNVSLRVEETENADTFLVSGRGELHLAILIETMRREGYEFQVGAPEVIFRTGENGERLEPYERVEIEVAETYQGVVVEQMGQRRGELQDMRLANGGVFFTYVVPTRGLLGFRNEFLTATRGTGVINTLFEGYRPYAGPIGTGRNGSLIATGPGVTTVLGLSDAEERGILFVGPGVEVYEGMIVGKHHRDTDLEVNVCKQKHLTNMRSSTSEIAVRLTPPTEMSLDRAIEYIGTDELVEVTPKNIRMRKKILDTNLRRRSEKRNAELARA
ncbi:MAG: translational GTPase TypA [Chloroherpetonaceae bacterium]|nr:translational GTPase TypA [Chthonomonadaceae bacterium]MDW8209266.1 translational GTPase TypA [Chloroherpetonaceae bacterium]